MSTRCSGSFYELLEIPRTATASQLKTAYHKQALKHHPDKTHDAASHERMKRIVHAYDTLKDPSRRRMYDMLGQDGMNTVEARFGREMAETIWQNERIIKMMIYLALAVCILSLISLILIAEKVDGVVSTSWLVLFIPVWILDAVFVSIVFVVVKTTFSLSDLGTLWRLFIYVLKSGSVVMTTLTFALALDRIISWQTAFIPVWFLFAGMSLDLFSDCTVKGFRQSLEAVGDPSINAYNWDDVTLFNTPSYAAYVARTLVNFALIFVFALLLSMKLTGALAQTSVWVIAAPLFLVCFGPMFYGIYEVSVSTLIPSLREKFVALIYIVARYAVLYFCTVVLSTIKAWQEDTGRTPSIPLRYVFIPAFVIVGLTTMFVFAIAVTPLNQLADPTGGGGGEGGSTFDATQEMSQPMRRAAAPGGAAYGSV